jgi:hypothetical protein
MSTVDSRFHSFKLPVINLRVILWAFVALETWVMHENVPSNVLDTGVQPVFFVFALL